MLQNSAILTLIFPPTPFVLFPRIVILFTEAKSSDLLTWWFDLSLLFLLYCYKNNSKSNSFALKTNSNTEFTFFLRDKLYSLHLNLAMGKACYLRIFCNFKDKGGLVERKSVIQIRCYSREEFSFLDGPISHHLLFTSLWISTSASVKSLCTKMKLCQLVLGADSYLRSPSPQEATLLKEESFSGQRWLAGLFHLRTWVPRIITQKTWGLFLI